MKRLIFVQRRRRRLWPAGLALLAALGLGSAWWAAAGDREHAPAVATPPALLQALDDLLPSLPEPELLE